MPSIRRSADEIAIFAGRFAWEGNEHMRMELRTASTVAIAVLAVFALAGCGEPAQAVPEGDNAGCSVASSMEYSPGFSIAKSPREAIVLWLATTRSDLSASIRAYGDEATRDRAAIADLATLHSLRSVDEVLAQNTPAESETSGKRAKLLGVDGSGHSVAITVSRGMAQELPDWMVTEYSIELPDEWCAQLPGS